MQQRMSLVVRRLARRSHRLAPIPARFPQPHNSLLHRRVSFAAAHDKQANPQPQQLCQQLAAQFGVSWAAKVQEGPHGLGVYPLLGQVPVSTPLGALNPAAGISPPLVELPACLAISNDQSSSSGRKSGFQLSADQQRIANGPLKGCSWEIHIGFLLTCLLQQQPAAHPAAAFWQQYSQLLPPYDTHSCLLCWTEAELQQLRDDDLMQEVLVWQGEVRDAYARCCAANAWGGPNHPSPITSSDTGSLEVPPASSPTVPSLETFVWAVAAVQSRAFAFVEGGRELVALLPYFDLFNHSPDPTCSYAWDAAQQTYRLQLSDGSTGGGAGQPDSTPSISTSSSSDAAEGPPMAGWHGAAVSNHGVDELTISYGQKSNRKLMEQYGFVVPGNPWDRVSFQGLELPAAHGGRRLLSHSAVRAAAAAIADKLKEQQQKQQQQLEVVAGGQPANCSKGGGASDDCQEQLVRVQCACASVLAAAGWRRKADYEAVTEDTTRRVVQVLLGWVEQRQAVQAGEYDVAGSGALHPSTEAAGCSAASDRLEAAAQYVRERAALLQATQHLLQQVVKV